MLHVYLTLALLCVSSYSSQSKETPPDTDHPRKRSHANGVKADYTGAESAHDLLSAHEVWQDFGDDWTGSSTLSDGSHNPNEVVGWGAASANAWTQTKPEANTEPQQQQPQVPGIPANGGYSTGYSTGYGYQQQAPPSAGYSTGYQQPQAPQSGGYSTGYTGTTGGFGYSTGYSSSGFGYGDTSNTGFGYTDASAPAAGGQMPGGQKPMGAPGAAQQGMAGGMPATGGMPAAGGGMPAAGGKPLPMGQGQGQGMGQGTMSGKCPLPHRHRKPWTLLTLEQKDLFVDGFQQIRKNGKLDVFSQTHAQHDIESYVHYTSLFSFYHAYMVWEVESAIRDLGGKFACFTMPYYDFTLDAGKEDDPHILKSGLGGDGDADNNWCVMDDETGFTWQTCSDYSAWRSVDETNEEGEGETPPSSEEGNNNEGITYTGYDDIEQGDKQADGDDDTSGVLHPLEIDYDGAYDEFDVANVEQLEEEEEATAAQDLEEDDELLIEAESVEEQCYWTQANCRSTEPSPYCCLKRKKSTTVLLPTASEVGDAIYRAKNIKEFQGYLNEWYNRVSALFGAHYYSHMSNGYATEDPIFWMTMSFVTHLRMLWQDCWNYNNIPKDKLDMHYNSYHPYCGTFDAIPTTCVNYNLGLDAPMNFYELQKEDWSYTSHKIVTVRKMWSPEYWNVMYELGPFYTRSGLNNWCDNSRDSEWFIETMEYDNVDEIDTEMNIFSQQLRENMVRDSVEPSGVFKTVAALSCKYNRKYSGNSCYEEGMEEDLEQIETCDTEDVDVEGLEAASLDDFLDYDGVRDSDCLRRIRRESFPYAEHSIQVKKQLCKGDWDYKCPQYNELLYANYEESLKNPIDLSRHSNGNNQSYFAKTGWIWVVVVNAIAVVCVAAGCCVWHYNKKHKNNSDNLSYTDGVMVDDDDDDMAHEATDGDTNTQIHTIQENEEYQPLLV
eukprot:251296_1